MRRFGYNTDGADIYRNSFAIIREENDLSRFGIDEETAAVRAIHAAGQTDLVRDIVLSPGAVCAARQALEDSAPILTDVNMIAPGITRERLSTNNEVIYLLRDGRAPELAQELGTICTTTVVELWRTRLEDVVVTTDNVPTASFRLLNCINEGSPPVPATILAIPVSFVGATESKRAMINSGVENPELKYVTVIGHRGGSATTCAALNAITTAREVL